MTCASRTSFAAPLALLRSTAPAWCSSPHPRTRPRPRASTGAPSRQRAAAWASAPLRSRPRTLVSVAARVLVRVAAAYDGVRVAVSPPLPLDPRCPWRPWARWARRGCSSPCHPRRASSAKSSTLCCMRTPAHRTSCSRVGLPSRVRCHCHPAGRRADVQRPVPIPRLHPRRGRRHSRCGGNPARSRDARRCAVAARLRLATLRFRVLPLRRRLVRGAVGRGHVHGQPDHARVRLKRDGLGVRSPRSVAARGALVIEKTREIGVLAYAEQAALVNTAALNGGAVAVTIRALSLYNRAAQRSAPAPPYTCNVTELAVGSAVHPNSGGEAPSATAASSCSVVLDQHATRGGALEVGVASRESFRWRACAYPRVVPGLSVGAHRGHPAAARRWRGGGRASVPPPSWRLPGYRRVCGRLVRRRRPRDCL